MAFVPYQGMPQGWMRQIIDASPSRPAFRPAVGCVGSFWDNDKKRMVLLNLGYVGLRVLSVFRAAASGSEESAFEGVEVAAQNAEIPFFTDVHFERFQVRVLCNTRTSGSTEPTHRKPASIQAYSRATFRATPPNCSTFKNGKTSQTIASIGLQAISTKP